MIPQVFITDKVSGFIEKTNLISENTENPSDLLTDEKEILVLSVNEIIVSIEALNFTIGELTSLVTTNQESVVSALNELRGTNYSTFGSVEMQYDIEVQRLDEKIDDNDDYIIYTNNLIGSLSSLETIDKSSVVNALNELDNKTSAVFKIEDYPDLGIDQFMGFLSVSNFVGIDKENYLKTPTVSGHLLFGDLDGKRYWGSITGFSDYVKAQYDYEEALNKRDDLFEYLEFIKDNTDSTVDYVSMVNAKVPYPIDTQVMVTVAATTVIDASLGDSFFIALNRNTAFSYINFNPGRNITLYIAYGNSYTITWPANTYFPKGLIPTFKTAERFSVQKYSTVYFTTKDTTYTSGGY